MPILRKETAHSINGVAGRLFNVIAGAPWVSTVFSNQTWKSEARPIGGYGKGAKLTVKMRFDDTCRNGHNDFAITGEVRIEGLNAETGGCLHEDIAKVFPELAPLIRWHLVSTNGPMHYIGNTIYHASDKDHNGRVKGQPITRPRYGVRFAGVPILHPLRKRVWDFIAYQRDFNRATLKTNPGHKAFKPFPVEHKNDSANGYKFGPKYTFADLICEWHECPFDTPTEAQELCDALNTCPFELVKEDEITGYSEGKKRELGHARSCAVWPEATDDQLCAPAEELKAMLEARLPGLLAEFEKDMRACGFAWSPADFNATKEGNQ